MTTTTIRQSEDLNLEQLINQAFDKALDFNAALHSALEEVGERFGLYGIMAQHGPITAACLATQAGIPERAARVWLDAQAAGNYLNHYVSAGQYCLWSSWHPTV